MGRLLRELMDDENEKFYNPDPELLPELMLLGTLEKRELSLQNGRVMHIDIVNYEGRNYAVKIVDGGKWFGSRDEIIPEVYATTRFKH